MELGSKKTVWPISRGGPGAWIVEWRSEDAKSQSVAAGWVMSEELVSKWRVLPVSGWQRASQLRDGFAGNWRGAVELGSKGTVLAISHVGWRDRLAVWRGGEHAGPVGSGTGMFAAIRRKLPETAGWIWTCVSVYTYPDKFREENWPLRCVFWGGARERASRAWERHGENRTQHACDSTGRFHVISAERVTE